MCLGRSPGRSVACGCVCGSVACVCIDPHRGVWCGCVCVGVVVPEVLKEGASLEALRPAVVECSGAQEEEQVPMPAAPSLLASFLLGGGHGDAPSSFAMLGAPPSPPPA